MCKEQVQKLNELGKWYGVSKHLKQCGTGHEYMGFVPKSSGTQAGSLCLPDYLSHLVKRRLAKSRSGIIRDAAFFHKWGSLIAV
jgi:hypothetical protein